MNTAISGGARISTQLRHCQVSNAARQVVSWKLERPKALNCQAQLLCDSQINRQVICFSVRSFDLARPGVALPLTAMP